MFKPYLKRQMKHIGLFTTKLYVHPLEVLNGIVYKGWDQARCSLFTVERCSPIGG